MAITMSDATIDDSARQTLHSTELDGGIMPIPGVGNPIPGGGFFDHLIPGESLAGITPSFATNVSSAIEDYCSNINGIIGKLEAVESSSAFKGSAIEGSLVKFIESVKQVSLNWVTALKNAEQQIIQQVQKVYETQDTDISSNLNSDASTLESNNPIGQ